MLSDPYAHPKIIKHAFQQCSYCTQKHPVNKAINRLNTISICVKQRSTVSDLFCAQKLNISQWLQKGLYTPWIPSCLGISILLPSSFRSSWSSLLGRRPVQGVPGPHARTDGMCPLPAVNERHMMFVSVHPTLASTCALRKENNLKSRFFFAH